MNKAQKTALALSIAALAVLVMFGVGSSGQAGGSKGLTVQMVGHQRLARPGGTDIASMVVAVNHEFGPVTGLTTANFQVGTPLVPAGGCLATVTGAQPANISGTYTIDLVPFADNPDCKWLPGDYIIAVHVATPDYAYNGTGVATLTIK